jgi:hypothetical protein
MFTSRLVGWLAGWLAGRLADWLAGWLAGWLAFTEKNTGVKRNDITLKLGKNVLKYQ